MDVQQLSRRIRVASSAEPADLVIKNGVIVNVFTGELEKGDIAIADGYIAGVGHYEGRKVIDADGKYIVPSFIDGHVHIESTMVSPAEFAKVQLMHGVTTIITDPHEIGNVSGGEGIQYMLDATEGLPFDAYFMLPSCVPATQFERAGAELNSEDLFPFYKHARVLGLAEVMNYPAVLHAEDSMVKKLADAQQCDKRIDGHASGLSSDALNVYMAAGIRTDHESTTIEEAKDRLSKGMYLMIREGTVAKDLKNIIGVVNEKNARRCLLVTDDRLLDDVFVSGGIDNNIRLAIEEGIPAVTAYQMATINPAECFGLKEYGAIAGGYKADMIILDNLENVSIHSVFKNGEQVMRNGELLGFPEQTAITGIEKLKETVRFKEINKEQLKIKVSSGLANIIEVIPNSLVTNHCVEQVDIDSSGIFIPSVDKDQLKIAVIERHHNTGGVGLGIVKGFGITEGAIASTVGHDSHNLLVAGKEDDDIIFAAEELKRMQGGLVVVKNGKKLAAIELPIAGLMSDRPYEFVLEQMKELKRALHDIGASEDFDPFLTLSFLALPVIPQLKITDKGLFNVQAFKHISVEA